MPHLIEPPELLKRLSEVFRTFYRFRYARAPYGDMSHADTARIYPFIGSATCPT